MIDKNQRCQKHPEFEPSRKELFERTEEFRNCSCCCGLYYACKRIGQFSGEYKFKDGNDMVLVLTPTSFENFGHLRFSLGWHYHFDDDPSWYVDLETHTIHFNESLPEYRLLGYLKEGLCTAERRTWSEPRLKKIVAEIERDGDEITSINLHCTIGELGQIVTLNLQKGSTLSEIMDAENTMSSGLHAIPNDAPVLTVVRKKGLRENR